MYGVIVLYGSGAGAIFAFTDWNGLTQEKSFVGLENFRQFLNDAQAIASVKNTLLIAFVVTLLQNGIGLLLALALNANIKSQNVLRTILFAPVVLPPLIIAYLWQYVYSANGALNRILAGLGLEQLQQNWLGDPEIALWSIMATIIWQFVGASMIIFLAGLQGIPQELYDAAAVDGAGAMQRFWNVTRPLLAPAITINLLLSVIGMLKLFDQVLAMTGGGPGYATETLSTVLYEQAFVQGNYGYGTAIALVLTMLVAAIAFVQLKVLRSQEVE
jgi:raffinose/stachyose/melibiose transport system permease protein